MPTNPFSAEGWNLTAQGAALKADRAGAERMAKEAGTSIGGPRPKGKNEPVIINRTIIMKKYYPQKGGNIDNAPRAWDGLGPPGETPEE